MKKYDTGIFKRDFNEIRRKWKGWEGEKMEAGAIHQGGGGILFMAPVGQRLSTRIIQPYHEAAEGGNKFLEN